ncbi:MAG: hypothetical protein JSU01_00815 [Bacteroidetes bacterium]|nr:hypothetical protein [Bacteroidota bacterium]
MKILLLLITTSCHSLLTNAQARANSSDTTKHEFKNAGEQENYWAEQLFKNEYQKRHFKKFHGEIIINGNHYQYGSQVLTVYAPEEFKPLFREGILYPDIIHGYFKPDKRIKIELSKTDTAKANPVPIKSILKPDSLSLSAFEELKFLEKSPHQKRFRFWMFRKGFANPSVYFIELTNNKATRDTPISEFVQGVHLTFVEGGWVII